MILLAFMFGMFVGAVVSYWLIGWWATHSRSCDSCAHATRLHWFSDINAFAHSCAKSNLYAEDERICEGGPCGPEGKLWRRRRGK